MEDFVMVFKKVADQDEKGRPNPWGYDVIEIVQFNYDGKGTALLRCWGTDHGPYRTTARGEDLDNILLCEWFYEEMQYMCDECMEERACQ